MHRDIYPAHLLRNRSTRGAAVHERLPHACIFEGSIAAIHEPQNTRYFFLPRILRHLMCCGSRSRHWCAAVWVLLYGPGGQAVQRVGVKFKQTLTWRPGFESHSGDGNSGPAHNNYYDGISVLNLFLCNLSPCVPLNRRQRLHKGTSKYEDKPVVASDNSMLCKIRLINDERAPGR